MINKKTKIFIFTILSVFLASAFISVASAEISASYDFANNDGTGFVMSRVYPNTGDTHVSAYSMSFDPSITGYLDAVILNFAKTGSPTTTLSMQLEQCASNNIANLGDGTVLAQATNTINTTLATTAPTFSQFTFQFNESYQIDATKNYVFEIYTTGGSMDGSNYISLGGKFSGSSYAGYSSRYGAPTMDVWESPAAPDMCFYVITSETPAPTATPTPTPTATPNPSSYQYWNGTHWVPYTPSTPEPNIFENDIATPYITMLVPIILLACASLIGWKFAGAWGFFAGLNIGAILAYMILGSSVFPLWGIVALLVIDGLLLFGKVGIRS